MEKILKTVKIVTVILLVILLSIIAFLGTYAKQNNVWRSTLPEFNYGIELDGIRELRYVLDVSEEEKEVYVDENGNIVGEVPEKTEESESENAETQEPVNNTGYKIETRKIKANEESVKTIDNFEKAKKIIQKRLENEDVYEYNIRLDNITGELILEVPNDDQVSIANTAVTAIGNFEIIDDQTGVILLDRENVKSSQAGMYQAETGYQACLQVYFDKEGAEKLKEISNKYRQVVNDAGETETSYISVKLDGQTMVRTYFGEELSNGMIQIPMGNATTDSTEINNTLTEVRRMADEINEEKLPISYKLDSDSLVESRIAQRDINLAVIVFAISILAISIILIVKYKFKGFITSVLGIGFIAILSILTRYTGIYVTLNSIIAFVSIIVLNYYFMKEFLLERQKESYVKDAFINTMKKYYLVIIPVCIIAIVFTFASNVVISSVGMILFWGLLVQAIYNAITILGLGLI